MPQNIDDPKPPRKKNPFDVVAGLTVSPPETSSGPDNPFDAVAGGRRDVVTLTPANDTLAAQNQQAPVRRRMDLATQRADATRVGREHNPQAKKLGSVARGLTLPLEMGAHILENPVGNAAEMVVAPVRAAKVASTYAGQKAAELTLPEDQRRLAEADPDRVKGEDAAIAAAQVASMAIAPGVSRMVGGLTAPLLGEAGAAVGHLAAGSLAGAAWMPDDPVAGAIGGAFMALPATRVPLAKLGDVSEGVVESAARGMAQEGRGVSPVPEWMLNDRFAAQLAQGANATRIPTREPIRLDPEAQATADFDAMLRNQPKRPPKADPVQGMETPADVVVSDAAAREQAIRDVEFEQSRKEALRILRGIRRRPGGVKPENPFDAIAAAPEQAPPSTPEAPPVLAREPVPEIGGPVSFGRDPKEPGRIPEMAPTRRATIKGEDAPGMYLEGATRETFERGKSTVLDRPAETPQPKPAKSALPEGITADEVKEYHRAVKEIAKEAEKKPDPARLGRDELMSELLAAYDRVDEAGMKRGGAWVRIDDWGNAHSSMKLSDAIWRQQQEYALNRAKLIEAELQKRYGLAEADLYDELNLARERKAMAEQDGAADFDFGENFGEPTKPAPSSFELPVERKAAELLGERATELPPPSDATRADFLAGLSESDRQFIRNDPTLGRIFDLPDVPQGAPRPLRKGETLANTRTWDPAVQGQAAEALGQMAERGVAKTYRSTAEGMAHVKALTRDTLVEMGMDPTTMDLKKVGRLTGEEIVAFKAEATRLMDEVAAYSKELERPGLTPQDRVTLEHMIEKAASERDAVLERVVTAGSQKGRDLGFLRQIAHRTLDPDVWVVQARRIAGDRPLSDAVIADIRRLAKETAEACALGGG